MRRKGASPASRVPGRSLRRALQVYRAEQDELRELESKLEKLDTEIDERISKINDVVRTETEKTWLKEVPFPSYERQKKMLDAIGEVSQQTCRTDDQLKDMGAQKQKLVSAIVTQQQTAEKAKAKRDAAKKAKDGD